MSRVRVVIADDHPIFRRGLREVVEAHPRFVVAAEAADGILALEALRKHAPDLAVLDISMPRLDGLEVLEQSRGWPNPPHIALLTMYDDYVERALGLGARGYVLKESAVDELVSCLETMADGRRFVSPSIGWKASDRLSEPVDRLTPTERRLLRLLARFKTSREIAEVLSVSHRTVQNHRANMCRKLRLQGSKALLRFAVEHVELP